MLTRLFIQNYALIDDVTVSFTGGLTTITGETGAGKSILLGGLGLILGNRADLSAMHNPDKKCVIEGEFNIARYHLQDFFAENELDFETQTIIRREILPGGKSRAFVNDTPVRLETLSELQSRLIDVHSQHQTLQLNELSFQYRVLDALAETNDLLTDFRKLKSVFEQKQSELEQLKLQIEQEKQQADYYFHLYQELDTAQFKSGELEELEQLQQKLAHVELIQQNIAQSYQLLSEEDFGIIYRLISVKNYLEKIKGFSKEYEALFERVLSASIELQDVQNELDNLLEKEDYSPENLEKVNHRLQLLYDLIQKHRVHSVEDLIGVYTDLTEKVKRVTDSDTILKQKQTELDVLEKELVETGKTLYNKRKNTVPSFEKEITAILQHLGMQEAVFKVELTQMAQINPYGFSQLKWLFSANKGNALGLIKQVASGGELSRIMLAVKSVLAKKAQLPTIIFDEIDTGISGEIALKMAAIMKEMSRDMQVICISHVPQIAAAGTEQLKVFKQTDTVKTHTQIQKLSENERLNEIAEMLGGKQLTESARNHAAELLQFKK